MSIFELVWPFLFSVTAAIIAGIHIRMKNHHGTQTLETFLMWQIAIGLGLGYLYAGMGHLFAADRVSRNLSGGRSGARSSVRSGCGMRQWASSRCSA